MARSTEGIVPILHSATRYDEAIPNNVDETHANMGTWYFVDHVVNSIDKGRRAVWGLRSRLRNRHEEKMYGII